ncbi:uncharacterized protein BDZ99DRAFT_271917 [Mytilinidion resinicola]|uniref:Uncharacterized protein n=1 Tax=Mytilinidion resinicola TaxID=574789 RepID=A0A6A6YUQ1_9PEZI|nr:uncharacterized protein BDZ99DRAFT_271917 [Mytilinidion resinicola]KAF2812686.1 hypothetical protein BDZ99DRAFT_271917 [Mytilinidion resinicola]
MPLLWSFDISYYLTQSYEPRKSPVYLQRAFLWTQNRTLHDPASWPQSPPYSPLRSRTHPSPCLCHSTFQPRKHTREDIRSFSYSWRDLSMWCRHRGRRHGPRRRCRRCSCLLQGHTCRKHRIASDRTLSRKGRWYTRCLRHTR